MANNTNDDETVDQEDSRQQPAAKKKIVVTEFDEPVEAEKTDNNDEIELDDFSEDEPDNDDETEKVLEDDDPEQQPEDDLESDQPTEDDQTEESVADNDATKTLTVGDAMDTASQEDVSNNEAVVADLAVQDDSAKSMDNEDSIDDLVDDIVRSESTEQLKEADAKLAVAADPKSKPGLKAKLKAGLKKWWQTTWLRNTTIGIVAFGLVAVVLFPTTRYGMLNTFGVRVNSSMTVIDSQTRLPLKNIQVQLQDKTATTDKQGQVVFEDLKLGSSDLAITKRGYADNRRSITLGWGSNPIGDQEIVATGEQFTFILVDWLSDQRVTDAEATAGESSANSDEEGKIVLTIDQSAIGEDSVTISADGYRDEVILPEDLNSADIEVVMVPDTRHAFVSNRNNKFDVYVVDLDGKNEELLVEATEKEREVPGILPHASKNIFALVSSRDGIENADNYILDGLFIIDSETGEQQNVGRSERIQLIGWSEDSLVYTQVIEGTSRGNAERSKLFSFNNTTGVKTELAAANYFNDIELIDDTVSYAVSSFAVPQSRAKLYSVKADGSEKKELLDRQVYTIFRTSQDTLLFNAIDQKWFTQTNGGDVVATEPVQSPNTINYIASPDGSRLAWSATRDGKGVLYTSDRNGDNEEEIAVIPGLDSVEYWADDQTIIFRIIKTEETADYVLNVTAPEDQRKISDVTASKRVFF